MVANAYLVDVAVRGAKEYQIAFFFFLDRIKFAASTS